jgi:tetratricopeptide (TPR) repeat protein
VPPAATRDAETARFETLIKAGKYPEAETAIKAFVAQHPDSWRGQYQLGYVQFELHRFHDSVAALCKSLIINRSFADAHRILAYDLNVLNRQDLAITELDTALRLAPDSADTHYELGRIYYDRGSYAQAIDHLKKARALAPDLVRVHHNLGLAYSAVGEKAQAVACFEEGLRRNKAQATLSPWPLIDYASFRNGEGQFAEARDLLLQAVSIDGRFPEEYNELSKAYRGLGQTSEAITALTHAIALDPQKADYHYMLARLYTKTNQRAAAQAELSAYAKSVSARSSR